jgi:hypothetical protein
LFQRARGVRWRARIPLFEVLSDMLPRFLMIALLGGAFVMAGCGKEGPPEGYGAKTPEPPPAGPQPKEKAGKPRPGGKAGPKTPIAPKSME